MLAAALLLFVAPWQAAAVEETDALAAQRALFATVYQARHDDAATRSRAANELKDYPLYPYLLYRRFDRFPAEPPAGIHRISARLS